VADRGERVCVLITGGAGYIAAGIIAKDLEVPLWWEPMDARASLRRLAWNG